MCGIAGFIGSSERLNSKLLQTMNSSLAHRGPDDQGMILLNNRGQFCAETDLAAVGLAHRRLSIIDLSQGGRQPMTNENGTVWIVFNGECYNYQDLGNILKKLGHRIKSLSDTEVLIHGYEQWGTESLLERLNGMFAFALWDQNERQLVLARDRMGKKPLFYTITDDNQMVFASEIKALVDGGFIDKSDIDPAALVEFWLYGYTTGERTLFKKVKRIPPGHYAIWKEGGITVSEYWDCVFSPEHTDNRSIDDYADELEELLLDSIRLRLIADVPVGVFLSSGIDSSLISVLAARLTGNTIKSFSIGFSNAQFDESVVAKEIAEFLHIANSRLVVNEDFLNYFEPIALHFDELFGDSSAIPTYFVCREARKHVTVVLTGDAGDELFAGYDSYAKALGLWGGLKERWLIRKRTTLLQSAVDWWQLGLKKGDERFSALERLLPLEDLSRIFNGNWLAKIDMEDVLRERAKWYARIGDADLLSALQYINIKTYLPDDILVKVDRMSMYHALECRNPFLDYRMVEFASRLPFAAKIGPEGERKYLLRKLLGRYLPDSIVNRPKMGFSVPWTDWCRGAMRKELEKRWRTMDSPYFNKEGAHYLFPSHKPGWTARQWNAYCSMMFFNS